MPLPPLFALPPVAVPDTALRIDQATNGRHLRVANLTRPSGGSFTWAITCAFNSTRALAVSSSYSLLSFYVGSAQVDLRFITSAGNAQTATVYVYSDPGGGGGAAGAGGTIVSTITAGRRLRVVLTYNAATGGLLVFINGLQVYATTIPAVSMLVGTGTLYVATRGAAVNYAPLDVAEVLWLSRVSTRAELMQEANGSQQSGYLLRSSPGQVELALLLENNLSDSSGYGRTITAYTNATASSGWVSYVSYPLYS